MEIEDVTLTQGTNYFVTIYFNNKTTFMSVFSVFFNPCNYYIFISYKIVFDASIVFSRHEFLICNYYVAIEVDSDEVRLTNKRKSKDNEPSVQGHVIGSSSLTTNSNQNTSKRKQTTKSVVDGRSINTHVATPFMNVRNSMSRMPFSDIINTIPSSNSVGSPIFKGTLFNYD